MLKGHHLKLDEFVLKAWVYHVCKKERWVTIPLFNGACVSAPACMLDAKNTEGSCNITKLYHAKWMPLLIFVSVSLNSSIVALLAQPLQ